MKKKIIALGATILGAFTAVICSTTVEAKTTDNTNSDSVVFDASNVKVNDKYKSYNDVASKNNVSLSMGSKAGTIKNADKFDKGEYSFSNALVNDNYADPIYTISAKKGTRVGIYYTLADKKGNVANNSSLEIYNETRSFWNWFWFVPTYDIIPYDYIEQSNDVFYSEFTFLSNDTYYFEASNNYLWLYDVVVVSNQDVSYRNDANTAIDNLLNYYDENGVSTNDEFSTLIAAANEAVSNANHVSNYDKYLEVLDLYNELVNVESSINTLVDTNSYARTTNTVIKYDAESKALLNKVGNDIKNANDKGISNEMISNYGVYVDALNKYNYLEDLYNDSLVVVDAINELNDAEYTEEYKNQLAVIENELEALSSLEFVSNYNDFLSKQEAFNELSNEKVNSFVNKVNAANEVKGETSSYVLINEANALYDELIESDKNNDSVVNSLNTLNEVKNAYTEMEEAVTENTIMLTYNADGIVDKVLFIGTIKGYSSNVVIKRLSITYIDNFTGETNTVAISNFYQGLKMSGKILKDKAEGVRYIYTKISNEDNKYAGHTLSMKYEVVFEDGHVLTSSVSTIEVE